jgi:hypothetical protein
MSRPTPTETLATAVARLPRTLRAAMPAARLRKRIIAGAYVDADGMGPLLGAHRYGVREREASLLSEPRAARRAASRPAERRPIEAGA